MYAQSAPPPCHADRPIDDIIGDIHKEQSNKKHRNKAPWPQPGPTPPTFPEPAPKVKKSTKQKSTISSESAPNIAEECRIAMSMTLEAARNVDIGDFYFQRQNYNGALQRYGDADEEKPRDIAINVRLGRAYEKLGQVPQATEAYKAAQGLAGPQKWSEEAKLALLRLQSVSGL